MIIRLYKFLYRKVITKSLDILWNRRSIKLKKFGSKYGEWNFLDTNDLQGSIIISCGLGEDASFEIELINYYSLNVIFIDPTPRAIFHFNELKENIGTVKSKDYSDDGAQNISSYDLSTITSENISLIEKAIWSSLINNLKLFFPKDISKVSLSVPNFHNNFSEDSKFIKVNTITYSSILDKYKLLKVPLLKLDIEGSEYNVISSILKNNVLPDQILVEFDELYTYGLQQLKKYFKLHNQLTKKDYLAIKTNHFSNQLYIKKKCLKKLH